MHDNHALRFLEILAAILNEREWPAEIAFDRSPTLVVANPDEPSLAESIICRNDPDKGRIYSISGGQSLGPVGEVRSVADRLQYLLRGIGPSASRHTADGSAAGSDLGPPARRRRTRTTVSPGLSLSTRTCPERLAAALKERGLDVTVEGMTLRVRNPGTRPDSEAGAAPHPGLSQRVTLRQVDGVPMWCWVWEPPRPGRRDAPVPPPDVEPMCPAGDIGEAARRIGNVLALRAVEPGDE